MDLDYGIIGNCRTAALVHKDSSIDWLCFPRFDSSSVFAKIIDEKKGGFFKILCDKEYKISQKYIDNTNVLETHFATQKNSFKLIDYFPHYEMGSKTELYKDLEIHRLFFIEKGLPTFKIIIDPRFAYGSQIPDKRIENDHIVFELNNEKLYLYSNLNLKDILSSKQISLKHNSYLILTYNKLMELRNIKEIINKKNKTINYWRNWIKKAKLPLKYTSLVARSALALRLLTYDDTGAIIAAATTSIPEIIGKERNWDYRYCWIRDASITVMSLLNISRFDVANEFLQWMIQIHKQYGINFQVLFRINYEKEVSETTLNYLEGYKHSVPVRIGNAASKQRQIDLFGELLDAIYLLYIKYKHGPLLNETDWNLIYALVESTIIEWKYKDQSIWEFRTLSKHYTFSKVLCWTALDRGIKIAKKYNKKNCIKKWIKVRNEIKKDIMKKGWNKKINAFTQSYNSNSVDASILLLPYFGFISYKSLKMKKTIEAITKQLFDGNFVMRYNTTDDFGKPRNALIACTFWYIDALYGIGKKREAIKLFEKTVQNVNYLGLLSEDIDRKTGEQLGNFPQAYSHTALINTAIKLFNNKK